MIPDRGAVPVVLGLVGFAGITAGTAWGALAAQIDAQPAAATDLNTWLLGVVASTLTTLVGLIAIVGRKFLAGEIIVKPIAEAIDTNRRAVEALDRALTREHQLMQRLFPDDRRV